MKIALWISRILFGLVFMFSGFVKAIDPLGSAYKFQDYFLTFGLEWLSPLAVVLAVLLSTLEFVVGAAVLLGLAMPWSALAGLIFMLFFTPLTLYIALTDPVPDCGCFGDAIIISNWDTFYKNIIILAASIIIFIYRKKIPPLLSPRKDWYLIGILTLAILGLSAYSLRYLPVIDFRPWKVGNNVSELLIPTPEQADIYLIFRNKQTGETREYPATDYPWDDAEWMDIWEYHDQRRVIIQPYVEAPISNFTIQDEYGDDFTEAYISNEDYQFIVVAYNLGTTSGRAFTRRINPLAEEAMDAGYSFIVLTGTPYHIVEEFRHLHQTAYPFYQTGEVALKTIIRSNPGLLLLKDGVVLAKWPHRRIPSFEEIRSVYME